MAVNGPPNLERSNVECSLSPEIQLFSSVEMPAPDTNTPSSQPVSPGKKRVRISDSTSIRVMEDQGQRPRDHNEISISSSPRFRRELMFPRQFHSATEKTSSPRILKKHSGQYEENECDGSLEYTEWLPVDQLTFLPAESKSLHSRTTAATESPSLGFSPFRDANNRVLVLSNPHALASEAIEGKNGSLYVTDRVTGWPLKRSPSLESRDNPFLPGGDLSKEAEELLKNATIVRDKFYLEQEHEKSNGSGLESYQEYPKTGQTSYVADGALPNTNNYSTEALEQRMPSSNAHKSEAMAVPLPRENGKVRDEGTEGTSPDGVRLEVKGSPTADGSKGVSSDNLGEQQQDKDKAKRRPKCCVLM